MQAAVASQDQIRNVMKDLLQEVHYPLQVALKHCLSQVVGEMFSEKLISRSVKDDPTYDKMIDEFEAGMKWKDIPELQDRWRSFLQILSNQGGPAQDAANHLATDFSDKLHNELSDNVTEPQSACNSTTSKGISNVKIYKEDEVLKELQHLQRQFARLMKQFKNELKDKVKDKETLEELNDYVLVFIPPMAKEEFSNIQDLNELLKKLHPYFDFLDCQLIVEIAAEYVTNELSENVQKHSEQAVNFQSSQSIEELRDCLMQIYNPHLKNPENAPKAHIKLNKPWNQVNIEGLYLLIKHFLPQHEKLSLINHITISAGSVLIKYIVRESQVDCLIAYAQGKLQFMRLVGMFGLVINDTPILADEDENENFTFDVALLEAAKVGHTEAVQFLLELGASVDTALLKAAQVCQNEAVSVLMELGGNIDNALLEAAKYGHSETVCLLLKLGASIDHHNKEGKTPLMLATLGGHEQVVQTLVSAGADVYIQDNNNYTALTIACEMNSYTICNFLLQQRKVHETTFITACRHVFSNVICLLQCVSSYITINSSDKIVADIQVLDQKFGSLISTIKEKLLVMIENRSCKLVTIAQHIAEYTEEKGLTKVTTIDELFNKIKSHCHFLYCHLIEHLVQCFLSGDVLQSRVKEYLDDLRVFEESVKLIDIKNASDKIHLSKQDITEPTCEIIIKLNVI